MIRKITAIETFPVRHPVLRAGKPIESCHFDGDDLETTHHFGYYDDGILVGIITLKKENDSDFSVENQYRIRGMAVLETHRKKDFGKQLVAHSEAFVIKNNTNLIWFNARIIAVGFYEKLGYSIIGEAFEMTDIGTHYKMFKTFERK